MKTFSWNWWKSCFVGLGAAFAAHFSLNAINEGGISMFILGGVLMIGFWFLLDWYARLTNR